ncbi:MAG: DUF4978 domain-containing protein [Clostridia bacterium]|nr:DUF4978 domain-containing protein [Clostridia bacterium]
MKKTFFEKFVSMACALTMMTSCITIPAVAKEETELMATNIVGSRVVFNSDGYERAEALEVAGEPFFYNGIQIRIDKVVDWYNFDDAKVKKLFEIAKNDGYTVVNVQIRWMDVQQDQDFRATETAYIRGGSYANQTFNTGGIQTYYEEGNESNQALAYLKFDISDWSKGDIENARIRVYNRNSLYYGHYLTVYGLEDTSWNKDTLTWSNAPGHSGYEVTGEKLAESVVWDTVKSANYYDFDVSEYVEKARKAGKSEVAFVLQSTTPSDKEPEVPVVLDDYDDADAPRIYLSSEEEYDWEYLDKIIGWAEEYDLKLEVLWFATDTCSLATDIRVPAYVLENYQKQCYSDGTPWLKKASKGSHITGLYQYIMCKNDMDLRQKEYDVLKAVFDHIAEYNAENGYKNTVIGCQVCNEPNVSRLHNSSVYENDVKLQNCQCTTCVSLKSSGAYSDQGFRDMVMFEYCDNLAKAVKKSNYPVWTRVNNVQGNDAWGVDYNENKRSSGGTDTENGTYLDFIGLDPYGWGRGDLYNFGTGSYSNGRNLPMVMESGGEKSMSALMMLATVAGGAFYNVYDLCSPDGHHMYDKDLNPRVISSGDKYLPNGGTYIEDVRNHNHWLNKIAYELATKKPDKLGGKNLLFFNCEGTDLTSINVTKQIGGMSVTYKSDMQYSSGIAIKKSDNEVVLLSSKDTDATFTLTDIATDIKKIEFGHYEGSEWVEDEGDVTYTASGANLVVTMPSFSVVKVETNESLPVPVSFEAEALSDNGKVSLSASVTKRTVTEGGASGGKWMCFESMSTGSTVTFNVTIPENMTTARVATTYKAKSSGRANFNLSINGIDYGSEVNATASEGFYTTAFGPIIEFNPGETYSFTYKTTSSGILCIDAISLLVSTGEEMNFDGEILIDEDFSSVTDNFGFAAGASVSGGQLNITENMANYTTSVKSFDAEIINQSAVEVSFDWKSNITSSGKKSGIEFRDMYGRLIFAIESKAGNILRHSTQGRDSDSSHSQYDWEPKWIENDMSRDKTYTVRFIADFETKTVSYEIREKDSSLINVQVVNAPIEASSLAKMIACNYYTNESGTSYVGTQNIDNFVLKGREGALDMPYEGKTVYAFGDSIVAGHKYSKAGFVDFTAQKMGMKIGYDGSYNGAKITNGNILGQVNSAPSAAPDTVIFTGGINDAYTDTDMAAFESAFDTLLSAMRSKWGNVEIVYVAVHKTPARDTQCQANTRSTAIKVCNKYSLRVADVYSTGLDATVQEIRWNYIFDDLGNDSLPGNMGTSSSEKFNDTYPSGTHPNFLAIEEFYVPTLESTLLNALYKFEAEYTISGSSITVNAAADKTGFILALYMGDELYSVHTFDESITTDCIEDITKAKVFNWSNYETLSPYAPCVTLFEK